ncbi:MAG: GMC family oxidoreductase N-terminal domain-containing protein [Lewinellaceae bacterium]|nr:GMC family oxidoreductase N-terminal domain-containing protein [Lewinellaceae bacterium]
MSDQKVFDYIVIGSGFGGSVSSLRLSEKGYSVLVLEKGKWFKNTDEFPKSNWNLKKWLWFPRFGWKGILKITFLKHVTALSGVGVGGGSLVYANTLPIPESGFFNSGSWSELNDWKNCLEPHYQTAQKMLGAVPHPYMSSSDEAMQELSAQLGLSSTFSKPDVAVYFGNADSKKTVENKDSDIPTSTPCCLCGGCMLGCRYNAKNTLDKNYLYLAQKAGATIIAEHEVIDIIPRSTDGSLGYFVKVRNLSKRNTIDTFESKGIVFAGGVLGTLPLLLKLRNTSLPRLSKTLGQGVRTNSESLIGVTSFEKDADFSKGISIGSIVQIDKHRHVEPVKYPSGSGFWRLFMAPMISGNSILARILYIFKDIIMHPIANAKAFFVNDWSKKTLILLYMESIDSTLRLRWSNTIGLHSSTDVGKPPTAFNPMAQTIARKIEKIIKGKAMVLLSESLLGIPTTAHILGGACMSSDAETGVIDKYCNVFGYQNMKICDGSIISGNIGVNPSLTITALSEYAMSKVEPKQSNLSADQ